MLCVQFRARFPKHALPSGGLQPQRASPLPTPQPHLDTHRAETHVPIQHGFNHDRPQQGGESPALSRALATEVKRSTRTALASFLPVSLTLPCFSKCNPVLSRSSKGGSCKATRAWKPGKLRDKNLLNSVVLSVLSVYVYSNPARAAPSGLYDVRKRTNSRQGRQRPLPAPCARILVDIRSKGPGRTVFPSRGLWVLWPLPHR